MKQSVLSILAICVWSIAISSEGQDRDWLRDVTNAAATAGGKARAIFVAARIKAALADRKDIRARYIRVRFDGQTLDVAGFVPDLDTARKIEEIAAKIAKPTNARSFWCVQYDLEDRKSYTTRVGEQASDAALKAKVMSTLTVARLKEELAGLTIQAMDVRHGKVRIYVIADAPSADTELEKYLKELDGIVSIRCSILKTFRE